MNALVASENQLSIDEFLRTSTCKHGLSTINYREYRHLIRRNTVKLLYLYSGEKGV